MLDTNVNQTYDLLKTYPSIQCWIMDRTIEVLNPYQETDTNIGGGSAGFISNPTEQTVMALCEDELLQSLQNVENALTRTSEHFKTNRCTLDGFVDLLERLLGN